MGGWVGGQSWDNSCRARLAILRSDGVLCFRVAPDGSHGTVMSPHGASPVRPRAKTGYARRGCSSAPPPPPKVARYGP